MHFHRKRQFSSRLWLTRMSFPLHLLCLQLFIGEHNQPHGVQYLWLLGYGFYPSFGSKNYKIYLILEGVSHVIYEGSYWHWEVCFQAASTHKKHMSQCHQSACLWRDTSKMIRKSRTGLREVGGNVECTSQSLTRCTGPLQVIFVINWWL